MACWEIVPAVVPLLLVVEQALVVVPVAAVPVAALAAVVARVAAAVQEAAVAFVVQMHFAPDNYKNCFENCPTDKMDTMLLEQQQPAMD